MAPLLSQQRSACLQLFTDGSCVHPACPAARHAAWSVVMHNDHVDCECLRALLPHGVALRAAFPVLAQGFLPGAQTIFRAETAALVQVVLLASRHQQYMFQEWTDSSSALQCLEAWLGGRSVSSIEAPIGDLLLLQLLPARRPPNLRLLKVQAHQDFKDLPDSELLPAVGNWAADEAAKAAEKSDLCCVPDYVNAIADWTQLQEDRFFMFCQYLLELMTAVVALRKQHRDVQRPGHRHDHDEGTAADRLWLALQPTVSTWCVDLPFCLGMPLSPAQHTWPEWFLMSLLEWGRLLQWPTADQKPACHHLSGITYLELLVNYVVCTKRLPPLRITWQEKSCYVDPLQAEGILQPVIVRESLVNFLAGIACLDKRLGFKLWPSARHHRLHSLEAYGDVNGRKGLLDRPVLHRIDTTGRLLGDLLQNSCGEILRSFSLKQ